jgi:putative ABC transport system permease protein
MSEAIIAAIQAVSYVVIVIIMAVMANTMAMTARERYGEYATFKALGFGRGLRSDAHLRGSRSGIALIGALLGHRTDRPGRARIRQRGRCAPEQLRGVARTVLLQVLAAFVVASSRRHTRVARRAHPHRRRPAHHRLTMAIPSATSRAT